MKRVIYLDSFKQHKFTNMKQTEYNDIVSLLRLCKTRDEAILKVQGKFPDISPSTVGSIFAQEYQKKMRKTHHVHYKPEKLCQYFEWYEKEISDGRRHVLMTISSAIDLSPALLARMVLEKYLSKTRYDDENPPRSVVTSMMKNTSLIDNSRLAAEVHECIVSDEQYGPIVDSVKHSIGHEYEFKLVKILDSLGLSYIGEDQMREKGYDKTPDIKLEIPISVDGHVINWIESKASFGDEYNNKSYLKDQFWSYWNRFGPGMVIYWFGFIEELDENREKGILLYDDFPMNIVKLNPVNTNASTTQTSL